MFHQCCGRSGLAGDGAHLPFVPVQHAGFVAMGLAIVTQQIGRHELAARRIAERAPATTHVLVELCFIQGEQAAAIMAA